MNRTDLTRYTDLIARRWRLLVIVIGLCLNASILQSFLAEESYEVTSRIVIVERPAGDLLLNRPARDLDRALQTELRALEGSVLRSTVNELLRLEADIDVEFEAEDPDLLLVTARYPTAQGATVIANTYASSFVAMRQDEEIADLELARGQVESQLETLQVEIDDLEAQLALDPADLRASVRLDARLDQQNELLGQIDDIDFLIASDPAGVELGEPAVEPTDPVSPRPVRSAVFALVLGSVLAVVMALLADSLDDTIRTSSDLEQTGVPILGAIPPASSKPGQVVSLASPESATAEAYRTLRASVLHSMGRKPNLLIQVTSASAGEGKTNVAANLAVSFAAIGLKTALIDADLRSDDGLGNRFENLKGSGLVEILTGDLPIDAELVRLGRSITLRGMPRGSVTINPAEVLSIDRARSAFAHFKESFDITIVDTPEILSYADATVVSGLVDATIVVLRAGDTKRKRLDRALTNLGLVEARVLGTVLVDAPDGLHRTVSSAPGFLPFDERMRALGVGPPQLPPVRPETVGPEAAASEATGREAVLSESATTDSGKRDSGKTDPIELPPVEAPAVAGRRSITGDATESDIADGSERSPKPVRSGSRQSGSGDAMVVGQGRTGAPLEKPRARHARAVAEESARRRAARIAASDRSVSRTRTAPSTGDGSDGSGPGRSESAGAASARSGSGRPDSKSLPEKGSSRPDRSADKLSDKPSSKSSDKVSDTSADKQDKQPKKSSAKSEPPAKSEPSDKSSDKSSDKASDTSPKHSAKQKDDENSRRPRMGRLSESDDTSMPADATD